MTSVIAFEVEARRIIIEQNTTLNVIGSILHFCSDHHLIMNSEFELSVFVYIYFFFIFNYTVGTSIWDAAYSLAKFFEFNKIARLAF